MTQPEGKGRRGLEESCAFEKKAVIKGLEFPVAFGPPLNGIMAAASTLSCGYRRKSLAKKHPQWILFGSQNSIANHPHIICHTYTQSSTSKTKVLCRVPFHPNPNNLQFLPLPQRKNTNTNKQTKPKVLDSWLGSKIYRPLRVELETSQDFKKSCLGQ